MDKRILVRKVRAGKYREDYIFQCLQCGVEFQVDQRNYSAGRGVYCSHKCYGVSKIGKPSWNADTAGLGVMKPNSTSFQPGHKLGNRFKKGHVPWHKGKKRVGLVGVLHPGWKGDEVGYGALHGWVKRHLKTPGKCEHCDRDGLVGRQIHWANVSGEYRRDLSDWKRLCAKCHKRFDDSRDVEQRYKGRYCNRCKEVIDHLSSGT